MPAIVDSSGWIEYFTGGENADHFAAAIQNTAELLVPSITLTEVYRWMLREATESDALAAVTAMKQGKVVALDDQLSVLAAELSHRHRLPLADGIIYTTAIRHRADLFTQDADLEGLPGVRYIKHPKRK
ncbi:MAG: type II toxin-antitoxin system VapC family toxin [Verrucomicrobiaceae bacterium]